MKLSVRPHYSPVGQGWRFNDRRGVLFTWDGVRATLHTSCCDSTYYMTRPNRHTLGCLCGKSEVADQILQTHRCHCEGLEQAYCYWLIQAGTDPLRATIQAREFQMKAEHFLNGWSRIQTRPPNALRWIQARAYLMSWR